MYEYLFEHGCYNWCCNIYNDNKTIFDIFGVENKHKMIYLTPDSNNKLDYKFNSNLIYIIGGLVDRNIKRGLSFKCANKLGIKTAKFNLDGINIIGRKEFNIDTVFKILIGMQKALLDSDEFTDWKSVFQTIVKESLPKRNCQEGNRRKRLNASQKSAIL